MNYGDVRIKSSPPPNSLASALRCLASYQLEDAMEVRMRMLRADNRAWKLWKWGRG